VHKNPLLFAAIKCKDVLEIARGKENARIRHDGFVIFGTPCNLAQEIGRECIARTRYSKNADQASRLLM
jgi:hypothetical protein